MLGKFQKETKLQEKNWHWFPKGKAMPLSSAMAHFFFQSSVLWLQQEKPKGQDLDAFSNITLLKNADTHTSWNAKNKYESRLQF